MKNVTLRKRTEAAIDDQVMKVLKGLYVAELEVEINERVAALYGLQTPRRLPNSPCSAVPQSNAAIRIAITGFGGGGMWRR